jgi:LysR family hydrogen peroxide-inducible transcriptional activator
MTYLVALHEHRHFGRAAAACFVTQSTLSVGIAELERVLGTLLVERSKRSVRFTGVGEEVVARARGIIRAGEDLVAVAEGAREPLVGSIRMQVIPTVAPFLLPRILGGVGERWPWLKLFVREALTGPACEALGRGTADCVLLALPADCGEVDVFEVMRDRLVLAVPAAEDASHRPIAYDAIDPDRLLLLEDGHCLRDHALAACKLAGVAEDSRLVASTLQTLVQLVDAGLGVTLLPEMGVAAGMLEGSRVHGHAVAGVSAERRIVLAWRKRHPREEEFRLLGATIRDVVGRA